MTLAILAGPEIPDTAPALAHYPGAVVVALDDAAVVLLLGPLWRPAAPRAGWEHTPLGWTCNRLLAGGRTVDHAERARDAPVRLTTWPILPPGSGVVKKRGRRAKVTG